METSDVTDDVDGTFTLDMVVPDVALDKVRGIEPIKANAKEAILSPFTPSGKNMCGVLLYGAPGVGKTMLVKAVANTTASTVEPGNGTTTGNVTFINAHASDLTQRTVSDTNRVLRHVFDEARRHSPSILFIDEIDLLFYRSEGTGKCLLTQLETISEGVQVVAATNAPWKIGREVLKWFTMRFYVPLPDVAGRMSIMADNLKTMDHKVSDNDLSLLTEKTQHYTGADLVCLIKDAGFQPIRKLQKATHFMKVSINESDVLKWAPCKMNEPGATAKSLDQLNPDEIACPPVTMEDFSDVLSSRSKPTITEEDLSMFKTFTDNPESA